MPHYLEISHRNAFIVLGASPACDCRQATQQSRNDTARCMMHDRARRWQTVKTRKPEEQSELPYYQRRTSSTLKLFALWQIERGRADQEPTDFKDAGSTQV